MARDLISHRRLLAAASRKRCSRSAGSGRRLLLPGRTAPSSVVIRLRMVSVASPHSNPLSVAARTSVRGLRARPAGPRRRACRRPWPDLLKSCFACPRRSRDLRRKAGEVPPRPLAVPFICVRRRFVRARGRLLSPPPPPPPRQTIRQAIQILARRERILGLVKELDYAHRETAPLYRVAIRLVATEVGVLSRPG